jgi:hypothetical protein
MILMALVAIAFTWLRHSLQVLPWNQRLPGAPFDLMPPWYGSNAARQFDTVLVHALPLLGLATLVAQLLWFVPPRASWPRLRRSPGFLLNATILGTFVAVPAWTIVDRMEGGWGGQSRLSIHKFVFQHFSTCCGWALLGGCLGLACLGRLRPGRSPRDRLVLFLAGLWLGAFLLRQVVWLASVAY